MPTSPQSRCVPMTTASVLITAMLTAACASQGAGTAANIDLGSGPPQAGTVKADALKGMTLTFVSYGGIYQDGQMKAAVDPFAKESGARILQDGPTDNAKIKAQVDSGNVTWDVIDSTNVFTSQHCGELFMPIDTSIVDISKIPPGAKTDDCSVPAMSYGLIVVYNTEKYGANPPKTWADFYDTAKFPGKRAIQGKPGELDPGVLEGALLADGVAPDKVYPIDVEGSARDVKRPWGFHLLEHRRRGATVRRVGPGRYGAPLERSRLHRREERRALRPDVEPVDARG